MLRCGISPVRSRQRAAWVVLTGVSAGTLLGACGGAPPPPNGAAGNGSAVSCGSLPPIPTLAPLPTARFDVTAYGADPSGGSDSAPAFEAAIHAAQARGGGEVAVPPGRYLVASQTLLIPPGPPVTVNGAGRDATTIVEGTAGRQLFNVQASGSAVENLTLDSQTHAGGPAFVSSASHVTVAAARVLGAPGGSWPVRFAGGKGTATPQQPSFAVGNLVEDLILHDTAPGQNDGLDFSFQESGFIAGVQHTGSRLGLYVDRDVTVMNYEFTPDPRLVSGTYGYYITDPSVHILVANFTSSGDGGRIGVIPASSPRAPSSDIAICSETMSGGSRFKFYVGDVDGLSVDHSTLGTVLIDSQQRAQVRFVQTSYAALQKRAAPAAAVSIAG
jgi:Pectate lyase superfamily protein